MNETPTPPTPDDTSAAHDTTGPRVTRDDMLDIGRLRRSVADRKIAGVAGGIAKHLDIDPLIVRILLVVLVFFGGAGLIIYASVWLFVPEADTNRAVINTDTRGRAVILIAAGALSVLLTVGDAFGGHFWVPWPLIAVALIVWLVVRSRAPRSTGDTESGATTRRTGPVWFWFAVPTALIGVGVLASAEMAGFEISASAYPALVLATAATFLVVGAFRGRPGGLILLGVLAALATFATAADQRWEHDWDSGEIRQAPTVAAQVPSELSLGAGEIMLDLTKVTDLARLDGRSLDIHAGIGRVEVIVPRNLGVDIDAQVGGPGHLLLLNEPDRGGVHLEGSARQTPTNAVAHLELDVNLGVGEVLVRTNEGQ